MLIDAHMHLWSLARGDYGWLTPDLPVLYRDFDVGAYRASTRTLPLAGAILVQAAASDAETEWLLNLAARHDEIIGVIGWFDPASPGTTSRLWDRKDRGMVGVRPMLQDWPDAWSLLAPQYADGLAMIDDAGLTFDALVRPHQLFVIAALAERHPELTIILDHGGKPSIADGSWTPWAEAIEILGEFPNVRCKLSGLVTEARDGADADDLRRYVTHLARCFGGDRLLWGSDWPLVTMRCSLAEWLATARFLAAELELDGQRLFGANARDAYKLETAQ